MILFLVSCLAWCPGLASPDCSIAKMDEWRAPQRRYSDGSVGELQWWMECDNGWESRSLDQQNPPE